MTRMQNRKLRCFKDEIYMAELKEWWMDAQDDVTDCFEYSKCNLNAKIDRSNVMEMQRTQNRK